MEIKITLEQVRAIQKAVLVGHQTIDNILLAQLVCGKWSTRFNFNDDEVIMDLEEDQISQINKIIKQV